MNKLSGSFTILLLTLAQTQAQAAGNASSSLPVINGANLQSANCTSLEPNVTDLHVAINRIPQKIPSTVSNASIWVTMNKPFAFDNTYTALLGDQTGDNSFNIQSNYLNDNEQNTTDLIHILMTNANAGLFGVAANVSLIQNIEVSALKPKVSGVTYSLESVFTFANYNSPYVDPLQCEVTAVSSTPLPIPGPVPGPVLPLGHL